MLKCQINKDGIGYYLHRIYLGIKIHYDQIVHLQC